MSPQGHGATAGWSAGWSRRAPPSLDVSLKWLSPACGIHRLGTGLPSSSPAVVNRISIPAVKELDIPVVVPNKSESLRGGSKKLTMEGPLLVEKAHPGFTGGSSALKSSHHLGRLCSAGDRHTGQDIVVNPAGKVFVKSLRTCSSLAELRSLLIMYDADLDCQAVTAVASHLVFRISQTPPENEGGASRHQRKSSSGGIKGQLHVDTPEQIWRFMRAEWLPLFRSWLPLMDSSGLCICVQSAAKVKQQLQQCAERTSARLIPEAHSTDGTGGGAAAVPSAGMTMMSEFDLDAVMQATDGLLHTFSTRSAVQLLWGLVSQHCRPPAAWLARYLTCTLPGRSLPHASPRDLSLLLWCLAKIKRRPPERWTRKLIDVVQEKVAAFDAQQLGMTLWALGTLHVSPGEAFLMAIVRQAEMLLLDPKDRAMSAAGSDRESSGQSCKLSSEAEMKAQDPAPRMITTPPPPALSDQELNDWHSLGSKSLGASPKCREVDTSALSPTAHGAASTSSSAVSEIWRGVTLDWQDQLAGLPERTYETTEDKGVLEKAEVSPPHKISLRNGEHPPSFNGFTAASLAQLCYGLCILNDRHILSLGRAVSSFIIRPIRSTMPGDTNSDLQKHHPGPIHPIRPRQPTAVSSHDSGHRLPCPEPTLVSVFLADEHGLPHQQHGLPHQQHRLPHQQHGLPHQQHGLQQGVVSILSEMGPRELMLLLMGLSNLGCRPRHDDPWLEQVLGRLKQLMAQAATGHSDAASLTLFGLAGTLWCLAQLGACPPAEWMRDTERSLIMLIKRQQRLQRHVESKAWISPGRTLNRHLVPPLTTVRLLAAFGALGYRPSSMVGAKLVESLCYQLPMIPAKHLFVSVRAIIDLDLPASPSQRRSLEVRSEALGEQRRNFRS